MAYTATQRKTIAKQLRAALRTLPAIMGRFGQSPFICDNVRRAYTYDCTNITCDMIAERIDHEFSLEGWLKKQSLKIKGEVQYDVMVNNGKKLQAYRKAWVQSLIKEFEA